MSEYCYQCEGCGLFKEECKCREFQDPMKYWKSLSPIELKMEMEGF